MWDTSQNLLHKKNKLYQPNSSVAWKVKELESPIWMMGGTGVCSSDADALETYLLLLTTGMSHKLSITGGTETLGDSLLIVCA